MTIHDFQNIKYSIRITRYYEKWKSRSENLHNFNEFGVILMDFNENHDILCFQPSETPHQTLIFLRKKQGLESLALQGARKT